MFTLDPFWVTGFIDGEGCFSVSFNKRAQTQTQAQWIEVRPSFSVSQTGKRSCIALQKTQQFFQCGSIRYSAGDQTNKYEVRSLKDLRTIILPHFEKYPLQTPKQNDFLQLCQVCDLMALEEHKNEQGA